jgi:KUP system potassium uptake protein
VFGDIGTSVLYALKAAVLAGNKLSYEVSVLGSLSIITWALIIMVTLKYIFLILRFDYRGQGGILALVSVLQINKKSHFWYVVLNFIAILGMALFFGDAIITPAISVLSAVEGLSFWSPSFGNYTVLIAVIVLIMIFSGQILGVHKIGLVFGPIMFLWFLVLAVSGLIAVCQYPQILEAFSPLYAIHLFIHEPMVAMVIAGAAFLVITGCEALYADLGQFGRSVITRAWLLFVMPALLLNYFGQGAIIIHNSQNLNNPFYNLFSDTLVLPVTLLATIATVIASQSVITGVFGMICQAMKLKLLPKMEIIKIQGRCKHNVFVPAINIYMAILTILIAIYFKNSDGLVNAYGISVAGAMITTSLLFLAVIIFNRPKSIQIWIFMPAIVFLVCDLFFVTALMPKMLHGGYLPLSIALLITLSVYIWRNNKKYNL